jgi:polysaccharide biosynthesis transport protein
MSKASVGQQPPLSASDRGEIDLVALFREVGRRKWLVAACTVGALVVSTLGVNIVKPRYTAETRVFLEHRDTEYTRIGGREAQRGQDPVFDQDAVLSQVQLIQSRDIARAMIKRFDLATKPEFDPVLKGIDPVTKVAVLLGVINNPAAMSPEERVLDSYFNKLKAFAVAKSRVVAIEFQSRDPQLAAKLSEAIAEEYIRELEQAKKGSARSAGSWLGRTIEQLRERVSAAEARAEAYRTQTGLFLVGGSGESGNISAQQLSELNTQLATARAQQAELTAKARVIRDAVRQGRIFEVSDVINNEVVRRLIENRATLKAQIAQEERTLLPQHPRIKELYAQLQGLEEQVRSAADRSARALENDARAAGARVAASQAELDQQKRSSGTANEQEVQLRALEREAKAEREQLETYLARFRDASVRDADNAVAADARVVSRAIVPSNPSFPKKLPIILVATLAGFAMSLFWILTRALLSDNVYARRMAEPQQPAYPAMMPMAYPPAPYPGIGDPQVMAAVAAMMQQMQAGTTPPFAAPVSAEQPATTAVVETSIPQETHAQPSPAPISVLDAQTNQPAHQAPAQLSEAGRSMQESLDRMAAIMKRPLVQSPPHTEMQHNAAFPSLKAPPLAPRHADLSNPVNAGQVMETSATVAYRVQETSAVQLRDIPDNALMEIASDAHERLADGRPVSILFMSVENTAHAAKSVRVLEALLKRKGSAIAINIDPVDIQPDALSATLRSLSASNDFVVINAGQVTQATAAVADSTTLNVLVATNDLADSRTDQASAFLDGVAYYIIADESADELTVA